MFDYSQLFLLSVITFYTLTNVVTSFSDACSRLAKRRKSTFKLKPISEILEKSTFYTCDAQSKVYCTKIAEPDLEPESAEPESAEPELAEPDDQAESAEQADSADSADPAKKSKSKVESDAKECQCPNCCDTCKCN